MPHQTRVLHAYDPAQIERIMAILDQLFPETEVPLDHSDPYTLLIAVLLSAQCTDKKVNEITPTLFGRTHPVTQMADTVDEIGIDTGARIELVPEVSAG